MRKKNKKVKIPGNKRVALGFMVFLVVALGFIGGYYIHHRNQCAELEKEFAAFKVQQHEVARKTGAIIEPSIKLLIQIPECK